jgi:hypothetical protein
MRHQAENNAAPDSGADVNRSQQAGQEKDPARADARNQVPAAPARRKPAAGKTKLEDLNDREDLSERHLSSRNWL